MNTRQRAKYARQKAKHYKCECEKLKKMLTKRTIATVSVQKSYPDELFKHAYMDCRLGELRSLITSDLEKELGKEIIKIAAIREEIDSRRMERNVSAAIRVVQD